MEGFFDVPVLFPVSRGENDVLPEHLRHKSGNPVILWNSNRKKKFGTLMTDGECREFDAFAAIRSTLAGSPVYNSTEHFCTATQSIAKDRVAYTRVLHASHPSWCCNTRRSD